MPDPRSELSPRVGRPRTVIRVSRKGRPYFSVLRRLRASAQEDAELQQRRQKEDKKLQAAIAREEKAQEAAEKKIRREAERIAAREELAREKAERVAEKEAKKVAKKHARLRSAKLKLKGSIRSARKLKRAFKVLKLVRRGQLMIARLMRIGSAR